MTVANLVSSPRRLNAALARPEGLAVHMIAIILVGHILIGIGAAMNSNVATVHAAITVVVALAVMIGSSRPERIVAVATYGGLCNVFWRMSHSRAPWELSKYILALGAVTLLVRFIRVWPRGLLPLLLLAALIPGMLITIAAEPLAAAREAISMNEMGLISFALAALSFRHLVGDRRDAWNLGWILIGPLVAVLTIVTHAIVTSPDLDFSSNSNFAASGGYGPNQVSSILGLIVMICLLLAFLPFARRLWPILAVLSIWAVAATFLTFSRGGIFSVVIAGCAMLLVGITTRGARVRAFILALVSLVSLVMVFNSVNDFTGNWLDTRYEKAGTTGRDVIAREDLHVFGKHPLLGVGSGRSPQFRGTGHLETAPTHTEFTRVLAEHGLLGVAVLALLVVMLVQAYRASTVHWNRLMVVALGAWSATTMMHAATRVGAVAVAVSLTQLRVEESIDPDISAESLTGAGPTRSTPSVGAVPGRSRS